LVSAFHSSTIDSGLAIEVDIIVVGPSLKSHNHLDSALGLLVSQSFASKAHQVTFPMNSAGGREVEMVLGEPVELPSLQLLRGDGRANEGMQCRKMTKVKDA
jgi:hypothetical protein